ncbi:hypothetical protein JZ751_029772 [Albula glossodonta]|uniref:Serine/threonine-protein kinase haspin n=1 Tax=Albula glossodonta TaxID=121402 RepID=A0A8T2NAY7_9TELE|nr:hypothetical protein JZ751_029772 [Albula glossodonta]
MCRRAKSGLCFWVTHATWIIYGLKQNKLFKMNRFGKGPLFLKTYGKRSRKVDAWLSPDIRKLAFSSTSSSDISIGEQSSLKSRGKRKKTLSTASLKPARAAKKRALTGLKDKDSDEENVFEPEAEPSHRADRKRRGTLSVKTFPKRKERKRQVTETTSESEEEASGKSKTMSHGFSAQKRNVNSESDQVLKSGNGGALPSYLGKFVTDRRRGQTEKPRAQPLKRKPSVCIASGSLNSSDDFVKSMQPPARFVERRKKRQVTRNQEPCLESTSSERVWVASNLRKARSILKEASFNRTADRLLDSGYKKPLLSSTPSLKSRPSYRHLEPSISEISCSNDEIEDAFKSSMEATRDLVSPRQRELKVLLERSGETEGNVKNQSPQSGRAKLLSIGGKNWVTISQHSKDLFSHIVSKMDGKSRAQTVEKSPSPSLQSISVQSSRDCNFMSAKTHLDSLAVPLKDRGSAIVVLDKTDVSKYLINKASRQEEETYSSCMDSESALKRSQSDDGLCTGDDVPRRNETSGSVCAVKSQAEQAGQVQEKDEQRSAALTSSEFEESASVVFVSSSESANTVDRCVRKHLRDEEPGYFANDAEQLSMNLSCRDSIDERSGGDRLQSPEKEHQDRSGGNLPAAAPSERGSRPPRDSLANDPASTRLLEACLKEQCISLQPTVSLKVLDLSKYIRADAKPPVYVSTDSAEEPPCDARSSDGGQNRSTASSDLQEQSERSSPERPARAKPKQSSGKSNDGPRRRLTSTFASGLGKAPSISSNLSASSPERKGRSRNPALPKDKLGTGRKACVSGLSVSRWTKNDLHRQRRKKCPTQSLLSRTGDNSLFDLQLGLDSKKYTDTMKDYFQSTEGVFPGTPLRKEPLNISSLLANFTPESLTTHTWSRLKAALSVHKKKKAFFTPKKLNLSHHDSLVGVSPDISANLRGSPQCTPLSRHLRANLLRSMAATPLSPSLLMEDISDAEKVYHECQQEGPISFQQCIPPHRMKLCKKVGEGTFGEVFSTTNDSNATVALKIVPIEGSQKVNGEDQKTFGEILHELIISKELSSLDSKENNKTNGFIGLNDLHCVRGSYPNELLSAWDKFDKQRGSENDRPDFFEEDQLFLILEFEFGGSDLENMNGKLSSFTLAKSILHQVTAALAVAEQALCFEHRDLHWGNILVKTTKEKEGTYVLNGTPHGIETRGIHVNIIDYSLSRLEIDGLTVSCDISADEELFMGKGDYQFDIYRKMREENNNSWSEFNPHTNVLWLHYLSDKLLSMSYKNKAQTKPMKELKKSIAQFHSEVLGYKSATDVLEGSCLFQKA